MEVGKLSSFDLEKDFQPIYYELTTLTGINGTPGVSQTTRIIHNAEQVVRCRLRDHTPERAEIKYFNMDGSEAAPFTLISGSNYENYVFDMCWSNEESKFIYVCSGSNGDLSLRRALSNGATDSIAVYQFQPDEGSTWSWGKDNGRIQITTGEQDYFLKVGGSVYRMPNTITALTGILTTTDFCSLGIESCGTLTGSQVPDGYEGVRLPAPYAFYPEDGDNCYNFSYQRALYFDVPSGVVPSGYLIYNWYDQPIDTLYVRSICPSGNMYYMTDRWALIDVPNYDTYRYPMFMNQSDPHALHYLDGTAVSGTSNYLRVFNIDDTLAAFINLNSSDIVMPAGVGDTAQITATVINCWGDSKEGKTVEFWISSGDGSIIPVDTETDSDGKCRAIFYAGANVGVTQVNAVVNEI
jgi:hypothetical protein